MSSTSRLLYLTDANFTLRLANSIHVSRMAAAFCSVVGDVTLVHRGPSSALGTVNWEGTERLVRVGATVPENRDFLGGLFLMVKAAVVLLRNRSAMVYGRSRWGLLAAYFMRRPFGYELHDMPSGKLAKLIDRLLLNSNLCILPVCITSNLAEDAKRDIPIASKSVSVLPDGADLACSTACQFPRKRAAYFGSFYQGKGIELLIDICRQSESLTIDCYGNIDTLDWLPQKGRDLPSNLKFCGHLDHAQAVQKMGEYSALLLPMLPKVAVHGGGDIGKYTSPLKLFEYMASGVPVLASDLEVLSGQVPDGTVVFLPFNDPSEWAKKIENIIEYPRQYAPLASNAKKHIELTLNWAARAATIVKMMHNAH